jgi:cobalamin synthase
MTTAAATLAAGTALGVLLAVATFLASPAVIVASVAASLLSFLVVAWLVRARGGLDGDGLGATIELSFAAILLSALLVR